MAAAAAGSATQAGYKRRLQLARVPKPSLSALSLVGNQLVGVRLCLAEQPAACFCFSTRAIVCSTLCTIVAAALRGVSAKDLSRYFLAELSQRVYSRKPWLHSLLPSR